MGSRFWTMKNCFEKTGINTRTVTRGKRVTLSRYHRRGQGLQTTSASTAEYLMRCSIPRAAPKTLFVPLWVSRLLRRPKYRAWDRGYIFQVCESGAEDRSYTHHICVARQLEGILRLLTDGMVYCFKGNQPAGRNEQRSKDGWSRDRSEGGR